MGLLLWATGCVSAFAAESLRPPGWAVATAHPAATEAAHWAAEQGGNAFDAAVAVTAALGVVEPVGSGLGGGGFWLIHRARDGYQVMVDGRERAPLKAHKDMYLDDAGEVIPGASLNGPLAAAIPGEPAALAHIAESYGRLPLSVSLTPAIELAREGFPVGERFRQRVEWRKSVFNARGRELFLRDGKTPANGTVVRQPELAATLREMSAKGRDGFYTGWVASTLVSEIATAGGIWSQQDLSEYRIIEREPVVVRYHGARIISASLPSSGGIVLGQILNMLQLRPIPRHDREQQVHTIVEAMRRAYRDRAQFLGDVDFVDVDQSALIDPAYARRQIVDMSDAATPSAHLTSREQVRVQGEDTSHFSIIDDEGNRVAATLSINYPFGSGFVSRGTGVILNNEMDDFVSKPGVANVYGLVGGAANAIAPGKRPLSSMSPTFVETDELVAIVGTPGGSRIITMVLLALLELLDQGERDIDAVVNLPRYHHQYLPDTVTYEPGALDEAVISGLKARGHEFEQRQSPYGDMHAVLWDLISNRLSAASDGRGEGQARLW
jgi:gamma-glutamyltranspeptidase/glutathione hydrolase